MDKPTSREALIQRAVMQIRNWGRIEFETLADIGLFNRLRPEQHIDIQEIWDAGVQQTS